MATIAENLQILKDSTDAIKQAIIDKGGNVNGGISTWADSIVNIETGPKEIITNKLNGVVESELSHTYTHASEIQKSGVISSSYKSIDNYFSISNVKNLPNILLSRSSSNIVYCDILDEGSTNVYFRGTHQVQATVELFSKTLSIKVNTSSVSYSNSGDNYFIIYFVIDQDNNFDYDVIHIGNILPCILKDSLITLSDNSTKVIQDITYDDELLVWNFDEGKYDKAKPLWIKKVQTSTWYYKLTFSDGNTLKVTGTYPNAHRLFNYTDQRFDYANECVGKQVYTLNGIVTLESCEYIEELVEHYNIITDYHMNLFANDVLTSCRYNNLYPIVDMKYDKSQVKPELLKIHAQKFKSNPEILPKYIKGMRLDENTIVSIEDMKSYISNLERLRNGRIC